MTDQTLPAEPTPRFRNAFEKLAPEIRAVPASALIPINVDVPTAVATVLGALPEIMALRPLMAALPGLNLARIDQLEELTLALGHAHGAYLAASSPPRSLEELGAEASTLRETLLSDTQALAKRGLIDGARLTEMGTRTGYRNVAFDLLAIVSVLRERWSAVVGKTAIALGELEQAEVLADRLVAAVGLREQGPLTFSAASEDRQRAFALFLEAYAEVRRAVQYLRFRERDAESIAPSLYAGRNKRRREVDAETGEEVPEAEAETPDTNAAAAPETPAAPVAPGMPGGSPFLA